MSSGRGVAILMAAAMAMGIEDDNIPVDRTPPKQKKRDKKAKRKAKIASNSRKANRKK